MPQPGTPLNIDYRVLNKWISTKRPQPSLYISANNELWHLMKMGNESGSRNNYTFVLSHTSCPQNSTMLCAARGWCKTISDLLLLVKTLCSCFLSLHQFLCGRDPQACFPLLFAFSKVCGVEPSHSAVWEKKILSCDYPVSHLVLASACLSLPYWNWKLLSRRQSSVSWWTGT